MGSRWPRILLRALSALCAEDRSLNPLRTRLRDYICDLADPEGPVPLAETASGALMAMLADSQGQSENALAAVLVVDMLLREVLNPYPADHEVRYRELKVLLANAPVDTAGVKAWYQRFCEAGFEGQERPRRLRPAP